jgi:hypothetical protein
VWAVLGGLLSVQRTLVAELDVLAVDCLDTPPDIIAGLSNGLIRDCDGVISLFGDCAASLSKLPPGASLLLSQAAASGVGTTQTGWNVTAASGLLTEAQVRAFNALLCLRVRVKIRGLILTGTG